MEEIPMNHKEKSFNTEIARLCGTNAAIVATQLWEAQANADAAFYIDGYPWVRASYKRITAYLPEPGMFMALCRGQKGDGIRVTGL